MSVTHRILRLTGCLLVAICMATPQAWAQAVGSGLMGQGNPMRSSGVAQAQYVQQHDHNMHRAPQGMLTAEFLGQTPRSRPMPPSLAPLAMPNSAMPEGTIILDDAMVDDPAMQHAMHGEFGDCACDGGGCGLCQRGIWAVLCESRRRTEYFYGVTSFAGPMNRGGTGSFGFEGGLNTASPLFGGWRGLGVQAGFNGTSTNFNGANFTTDTRTQAFVTLGLFRRVDWGLQGGVVIDHLHEDWYANGDISQIRGELSWVVPQGSELGMFFTASNDDETVDGVLQNGTAIPTTIRETWQINDIYAIFLRHTFCGGGYAKAFAGWTGTSDGVLGAEAFVPLSDNWALRNSFTYIVPEEGPLDGGHEQEFWNLSMQVVWTPYGRCDGTRDYYRPLFNVANNGTMFVNR